MSTPFAPHPYRFQICAILNLPSSLPWLTRSLLPKAFLTLLSLWPEQSFCQNLPHLLWHNSFSSLSNLPSLVIVNRPFPRFLVQLIYMIDLCTRLTLPGVIDICVPVTCSSVNCKLIEDRVKCLELLVSVRHSAGSCWINKWGQVLNNGGTDEKGSTLDQIQRLRKGSASKSLKDRWGQTRWEWVPPCHSANTWAAPHNPTSRKVRFQHVGKLPAMWQCVLQAVLFSVFALFRILWFWASLL